MTDEFLWEQGGFVYICGFMLVVAAIAIAHDKVRRAWDRFRYERNSNFNRAKRR